METIKTNQDIREKLIVILDNHVDFAEWGSTAFEETELQDELLSLIETERKDAVKEFAKWHNDNQKHLAKGLRSYIGTAGYFEEVNDEKDGNN